MARRATLRRVARPSAATALLAALAGGALLAGAAPDATLIRGGTVVNADRQFLADVLIVGDTISAVGLGLKAPAGAQVLNATGRLVMPGGIETHSHLTFPAGGAAWGGPATCEDAYTAHASAAAGGTTTVFDFIQSPQPEALEAGLDYYMAESLKGALDFQFHAILAPGEPDVGPVPRSAERWAALEAAMEAVVKRGVASFKLFMSYWGALMLSDQELIKGLAKARQLGAVPLFHAENGHMAKLGRDRAFADGITGVEGDAIARPPLSEGEATKRILTYAWFLQAPAYIVHVMSADGMAEIAAARARGQKVVGEAIVASISVDHSGMFDADYDSAARFTLSPPLRPRSHVDALARGLAGGALQLVGTDPAAFNTTQKRLGRHDFREIPLSGNGIEERLHVTWDVLVNSGMASPSDFVRVTSTEAARIFNLYPRKGVLAAGSDADVIIFDPAEEHTLSAATAHGAIDTSLWEGRRVRGRVTHTLSRGRLLWADGVLNVPRGTGRFVPAAPFGSLYSGAYADDMLAAQRATDFPAEALGVWPVAREGDAPKSAARDEL